MLTTEQRKKLEEMQGQARADAIYWAKKEGRDPNEQGHYAYGVSIGFAQGAEAMAAIRDEEVERLNKLNHPCKETCSGWRQGYDAGKAEGAAEERKFLRSVYEEFAYARRISNTLRESDKRLAEVEIRIAEHLIKHRSAKETPDAKDA